MKPSIGRIVIARVDPAYNAGSNEAPAVIVKVHSESVVNLRIFVDTPGEPLHRTSYTLYAEKPDDLDSPSTIKAACWWLPRVSS